MKSDSIDNFGLSPVAPVMPRDSFAALSTTGGSTSGESPIHIISLGAGVQSSAVAFMAAKGEITPMPAFAVFADTGDEPKEVYDYLEYLRSNLPFRVKIAHRDALHGKLSDNIFQWGHSQIPAFFKDPETGQIGIGKRQCTKHWKITPVHRKIREALDVKGKRLPDGFVTLWQGISSDEASRAKDSREPWINHRFPLLEKMMDRQGCKKWLRENGYEEPPKSACIYCPFRSESQWRKSREKPEEWEKILRIDRQLNARNEYLHPTCQPIDQVALSDSDRGQINLFNNECEGMCGV